MSNIIVLIRKFQNFKLNVMLIEVIELVEFLIMFRVSLINNNFVLTDINKNLNVYYIDLHQMFL